MTGFDPVPDPFAAFRRVDRYALGAGDGLVFAPPHPIWLDQPGFWDGVYYYLHLLRPAFTISLVDGRGCALPLRAIDRVWTPDALAITWSAAGLALIEHRCVLPGGELVSEWRIDALDAPVSELAFVAWTAWEGADVRDRSACDGSAEGARCRIITRDAQSRGNELALDTLLRIDSGAERWGVAESQHARESANLPDWAMTPFADARSGSGLRGDRSLAPAAPAAGRTLVFLAVSRMLSLPASGSARIAATFKLRAADAGLRWRQERSRSAPAAGVPVPDVPSALASSRALWRDYFDGAPSISCSDPWVEHCMPNRWFGLRLNFLDPAGGYAHPTCAEGTEFFHDAVAYSAWCHMRELRWLTDPSRARGTLRTFLDHQRGDGALPGIIYLNGVHPTASYFADWGGALLALDEVHPDPSYLREVFPALRRYAAHMDAARDPEGSGLYEVRDPYETGQETMSRYTAVERTADRHHFDYRIRLAGVDLTVYMYRLHRALAWIAAQCDDAAAVRAHDAYADRIGDAVRARMWDPDAQLFFDVDPRSGERTGVRAAICFYPYMTDIADDAHLAGLERNLFDPATFWTPFPVPSTAATDPTFDEAGRWNGIRQNCPWNGRVWPMTNCHVIEALAHQALTRAPRLRERAAELLLRTIHMMCFDGDPARPNSFEHYSPVTGRASVYRGLDDYQHSWINDLIIRVLVGFEPAGSGFAVAPFPSGIERLRLERLPYRGARISIDVTGDAIWVDVDGRTTAVVEGGPLVVR